MWRKILAWGTLALVLLLAALMVVLVSPVGLRWVLNYVRNTGTNIQARNIQGWLWDFTLQDVAFKQPGIQATAGSARVRLGLSEIFSKTIHIQAALNHAHIDIDPSKFTAGGEGVWQTRLDALQVSDTTVNLNGTPFNFPDAELSVKNLADRQLESLVKTKYGKLTAQASFDPALSTFKMDFNGDASILQYYYPGIKSGVIQGTYAFTPDKLEGDVRISGGRVQVPEFQAVDVTQIQGLLHHQGDVITADLSGLGLGGSIQAHATVDLNAEQYTVLANGTPQLKNLKLGDLDGKGKLHIEVAGWEKVKVSADYTGTVQVPQASIPDARLHYELDETLFSRVTATGTLNAFDQSGQLKATLKNNGKIWLGDATLAGKDIQARAHLEDQLVYLTGRAFKVDVAGNYRLDKQTLQATAHSNLHDFQENLQGDLNVRASGTLDQLNIRVLNSQLNTAFTGPLSLNGQGSYKQGVLDLSTPHLDLTYQPSGATWNLKSIPLQGIGTINGRGNLVGENLLGTVGLSGLPSEAEDLRGELSLNTRTLNFQLNTPRVQARGTPENFQLDVQNYTFLGGVKQTVSGNLVVRDFSPVGKVRVSSIYQDVTANLSGLKATLSGTLLGPLKGLPVSGTADLEKAQLNLGGILTDLQYQPLKATLRQENQTLNVSLTDGKINARGSLPLATVQKMFNLPVSGTLSVDLVDSRGSAVFKGAYQDNQIQALLKVTPEQVTGQVDVKGKQFTAAAQGNLYPQPNLKGTISVLNATSNLRVFGTWDALKYQANGNTPEFVQGDLLVKSKPFQLQGTLMPAVTASGMVGGLKVNLLDLNTLKVSVSGQETLLYQNAPYTVQLSGTWNPDWAGQLSARLQGPRIQASARGAWKNLTVDAAFRQQDVTLRASAKLNLPAMKYAGSLSAQYRDLKARGTVQGTLDKFRINATVISPEKGSAQVQATGLDDIRIQASNFVYQDIAASGNLKYASGKITGLLQASYQGNTVSVNALGDTFTAKLNSSYGTGTAEGKLDFSDYQIHLGSDYFTSELRGNLKGLSGTLTTVSQSYSVLEDQAQIPAQTFTVKGDFAKGDFQQSHFTLSQGNEEVLYVGGQVSGGLTLSYALRDAGAGQVHISPTLQKVNADFTGLITGQAKVYPDIEGTLDVPLSLVTRLIPGPYRSKLTPGRVQLAVSGPYNRLNFKAQTSGVQWQNQSLTLQGNGFWTPDTYQVAVHAVHPLVDLQAEITPQKQTFEGTVDAALVPDLPEGLAGKATLKGNLSNFEVQTLAANGTLNARYQEYATSGTFEILPGLKVQTDLKGDALQKAYQVRGQVYPDVNASVRFDQAQGTVQGTYDSLLLALKGQVFDQDLDVKVQTQQQTQAILSGTVDGSTVSANLDLTTGEGKASIQNLNLQKVAKIDGLVSLQAELNTYQDAVLHASGMVQDIAINGDFQWKEGILTASTAQASLTQGTVQASGQIYPDLSIKGTGKLLDPIALPLTFEASGELQNPLLQVHATLPEAYEGVQLKTTTADIEIRNLKDIQVELHGAIAGKVQATYQDALTLQNADLQFNTISIQREEVTGLLTGQLAWNGSFTGGVQFAGKVANEPLQLKGTGKGNLALEGSWKDAAFTGSIEPDIFKGLSAQLSIPQWDVSSLVGLKDPVLVGATATVQGPWNALKIQANGQVKESLTSQTVQFSVAQKGKAWEAQLAGAIKGTALYAATGWTAQLTTENLNVGAFVPQLKQGILSGAFDVSGKDTSLSAIKASNLNIVAADLQDNPIRLQGSAVYSAEKIDLNLTGNYASSPIRLGGTYPDGIQAEIQNFKIADGVLNLSGTVSGDFSNPDIQATGSFEHALGSATLQASGKLQDLVVSTQATLKGDIQGKVSGDIQVKNLDVNQLVLKLTADVTGAGVLAKGTIEGTYPHLSGQMKLQRGDAYVTLTGNGDGTYQLSDSNVATGTIKVQPTPLQFSGDLLINAVPLLEGASGRTQVQVKFEGDLQKITAEYAGTLSQIAYMNGKLQQATLKGTFSGPYTAPEIQLTTQFSGASYQQISMGSADLTLHSVGDFSKPDVEASGTLQNVKYQGESLQQARFSGTSSGAWEQPTIHLNADLAGVKYQDNTLDAGKFLVDYQGQWNKPTIHLNADLAGVKYQDNTLDAGKLLVDYQGQWNKPTVHLTGDLTGIKYQDFQLQTSSLAADYAGTWPEADVALVADGTGFRYQDSAAESSVFHLQVNQKGATSLLDGSLTALLRGVQFKGDQLQSAEISGTLKGNLSDPQIHLQGKVQDLQYKDIALRNGSVVADSKGPLEKPSVTFTGDVSEARYQQDTLQAASFSGTFQGDWNSPTAHLTGKLSGVNYQDYQLQNAVLTADHQGNWQAPSIQLVAEGGGFVYQEARVQNFKLNGSTQGDLKSPDLRLNATLNGIQYQEGQLQQAQIAAHLQGELSNPTVAATGNYAGLKYQDATTPDGAFTLNGTLQNPAVTLLQGGKTTLVYQNQQVQFSGFNAKGFDHSVTLEGTASLKQGNLKADARGPFSGHVEAHYQQIQPLDLKNLSLEHLIQSYNLQVQHQVAYQGYQANGRFSVNNQEWSGTGNLGGLPSWLTAEPLSYRLAGKDLPTVYSTLKAYGLQANVKLDTQQAILEFLDTPDIQANGSLAYRFADSTFSGSTEFQKDTIKMLLQGTGKTLQANLQQSRTTVQATATISPLDVQATINDGVHQGTASYTEAGWNVNIPTFEVGSLDGSEYQGQFSLTGKGKGSTGTLDLKTTNLKLPFTIPVLDEKVQGDLTAHVVLGDQISAVADYTGPLGTLNLTGNNQNGWNGQLKAKLHTTRNPGTLDANLTLQNGQVQGKILVDQFGYTYKDIKGIITGQVDVEDSQFTGTLQTRLDEGSLLLEGQGSLADVVPALENLGIAPSDEGYLVTVSASAFPLEKLGVLPYAKGHIYGTASLTGDTSTVNLRVPDLSLPGGTPPELEIANLDPTATPATEAPRTVLSARLDGTFSGGDARLRGSIGDTTFVASSTSGVLVGTFDFRNTPLHALIGAYTDALPGQALLTGTGRIDGKLSELDKLRLSVVAENIKVTSAGQTLMGQGQFSLEQGALTIPGIQLTGAGSLLIQGVYAPDQVNLSANFKDTTFTPLLALVPALKDYKPSLKGNLSLKAMGDYGQPTIQVQGNGLQGELAGLGIQMNQLNALLKQNQLTFQSDTTTSGVVDSTLKLEGKANLQNGSLQNAQIDASGSLSVDNFGTLEGTTVRLNQQGEAWKLLLTGTRGGKIQATGDLYPDLNVRIQLDQVAPDLQNYYIKDASATGVLNLTRSGEFYRLAGNVDLEKLQFTLSKPDTDKTEKDDTFEFESPLSSEYTTFPQQRQDQDRAALSNWIFDDILIDAKNNIRIDENLARAEFGGQLVLSGNAYTPRLQGDILPKRGSVFLRENEFVLNTGATSIRFNAADGAYPKIYLEGLGIVRDEGQNVRVIMTITGNFKADPKNPRKRTLVPVIDLREEREVLGQCADPVRNPGSTLPKCLDEASLYALVVFGTKDLRNIPTELTQSALRTTLQVFVVGEIERSIAQALGIDVFRIRNYTIGADQSFNAEFTVGTYLSREWYIQYQVDLLGNGNVEVQYNALDGKLSLSFSSPLNKLDFNSVQPEFSLAYNFDAQNSIELGIRTEQNTQGERGFSVKLGYKLKF
ncbi:translocation/assembly module TamB domain-containing protein [Deinococcus roseus]|uniref:Translocation and assembly module TamB C-terminal domain-containing protein n=1 Tax=Deinococcus roseus TaxID=392414 RepID=A0ABQ2CT38_9DEIO|nr:hypothetical protein [Deinococcus roseus]GGJ18347.1 hypothetical protein GCM10008938_00630 [Deinococcus roseus]